MQFVFGFVLAWIDCAFLSLEVISIVLEVPKLNNAFLLDFDSFSYHAILFELVIRSLD
jgi:hypothetical protein